MLNGFSAQCGIRADRVAVLRQKSANRAIQAMLIHCGLYICKRQRPGIEHGHFEPVQTGTTHSERILR
jgi:hypothetical protein